MIIENFKRFISPRVKNSTFSCLQCGKCCKFSEIILSNREIRAISTHLYVSIQEFKSEYLIKKEIHKVRSIFSDRFEIKGEVYILKKKEQKICPFYQEIEQKAFCNIYHFRPIVCRLFPFTWKTSKCDPKQTSVAIDYSPNGWEECPGINYAHGKAWDDLRDEVTGAVLLSIIQSNELITDGYLTQHSQ
ncbi:MAG: YkgJ family cysteine cluster protein [Candidatus Helarchaeota archaeon]|nr:YkgJ family cysteine cluster protein [Candidatus Helarchaeota archaeon]